MLPLHIPELTEGTTLERADILCENGIIKKIRPCGYKYDVPEGTEEMDIGGQTLMPGFIDAHVHLRMMGRNLSSDPYHVGAVMVDEINFARFLLDNGYTTVRDVGDNIANLAQDLRDKINKGDIEGPRIFCSGPTLAPYENGFDSAYSEPHHYYTNSPEEMRARARYNLMKGADFIKLYGTGSMCVVDREPGYLIMTEDEMKAAVEIANMKETYCAIHCHGENGCDRAAHAGVKTIEHASFIGRHTLEYLETRKKEGQGIVITASVLEDNSWGDYPIGIDEKVISCLKETKNYDILIGWGTDTSLKFYKENPYTEFQIRSEKLGFSNIEILKQLTIESAVLIMKEDMIGSIKEGKYADFCVINGNPVVDITILYKKPEHIIKGGKIIR